MDAPVVNSTSDLIDMAPADLFSSAAMDDTPIDDGGADDFTDPGAGADETFDTPESLEDPAPAAEEPVDEPEETPAPDATEKPAQEAKTEDELPEGVVRGKDRNGKPGLFVEDNRWKNIYANHQTVQQVSEMLGEPATIEALQLRNDAYLAQERLYSDLTSGDPASQGRVLNYFLDEMQRAREQGEVGVDASVPLAKQFYTTLKEKSPDGFASLRLESARDLVTEMLQHAASTGDESLWISAQHFVKALTGASDLPQIRAVAQRMGLPFHLKEEMQGFKQRGAADPVAHLQAENERLQNLVNGKTDTGQAAQFDSWFQTTAKTVQSTVLESAIKPALASVEKQWKEFPSDYQDLVVDRLHRKVTETIRADGNFNDRIKLLNEQARRATSAQRRDDIGKTIQQAYSNRARLAVEAVKKPILEFAAKGLVERTSQNHTRRTAAQTRTAPNGPAGSVPRSLTPNNLVNFKDNVFDAKTAMKQAAQLLGS